MIIYCNEWLLAVKKLRIKSVHIIGYYSKIWCKSLCPYIYSNKVSLQTSLEGNPSNLSYIFFSDVNFENLTVEFHVPYVLNMYIKFRSNRILFIIWSMNLFFIHNFRLQKLEILTFIWWHSNWSLIFLKFFKHEGYN